jgi:cysteine desulfurase/selenocysteine lyase
MLGPTGTGLLYGKEEILEAMPPYQAGGEMVVSVDFDDATFKRPPHKFEAGTPNIAGVVGLGAAIDYLNAIGMERVAEREQELLNYGTPLLESIDEIRILGSATDKGPIWSFWFDDTHAHDIAQILDAEDVAIRAGHHCAQPLMHRFGIEATARASLAFYNTTDEIDAFVEATRKVREVTSTKGALYQQTILDHNRNPRNFGEMADATAMAEGNNRLCGDKLSLGIKFNEGKIVDLAFTGSLCAIAKSSASVMTSVLKDKTKQEAMALYERFRKLVTGDPGEPANLGDLGDLAAFATVREFPVRVKCATLGWDAMIDALEKCAGLNGAALRRAAGQDQSE